jgi:hypothetical protein
MLITLVALICVVGGGLWLWMLIECATREPSGTDKIVWILVILLGGFVGALVYLIVRRPKRIAETGNNVPE